MAGKKKGNDQDKALKTLILVTAALNLAIKIIDLIVKLIE